MSEVVTELVIDANTSGADQFTDAMGRAKSAAQDGVAGIGGLSLSLAGVGAAFIASMDAIKNANKDLADLASQSDRLGLSLKDLQGIKLGAGIAGLTDSQTNQGLEKSAQLLNDAGRNANSLSKELDANGISIHNANGQLISENQLLSIAADLVSRARNPQDAAAIAQMLGFTKEWVPLLAQGSEAMNALGDNAKAAGAVIDDETIQRASEFDAKWRASSVLFTTNMKAALADLLPFIDDLIDKAAQFAKFFNRQSVQLASDESFKQFNEATGIPESGVIQIDTGKLHDGIQEWASSPIFSIGTWTNFGRALWGGFSAMSTEKAADTLPGFAASQVVEPSYPTSDQMNLAFKKYWKPKDAAQDAAQDANDPQNFSKVAAKDTANDSVDRAINTLTRHTQQQIADTQAVGLGDAALANFRATAAETAAVQANQGKETDAQKASFLAARDAATAAADAFAKAKVATQIDFNSKTAFLSTEDVAIATQLKGIYGNDVPKALDSTYAAAIQLNTAFKSISTGIESGLVTGLTDIVTNTKSVSAGFTEMGQAIIKALDQALIKMLIVEPIMKSLQGLAGGFLGTSLPQPGSGAFIGPVLPSANGNIFSGGNVIPFAAGGVVGSPTLAPMALFGEAGPEAIVPLKRGSDGSLGVSSAGGGGNIAFGDINISVPEGTTPENASAIGAAVKSSMIQVIDERLNYQMRGRGILRRAS